MTSVSTSNVVRALIALSCCLVVSCGVVRYSPALDTELTAEAREFLEHNSVVIAENQERGSWIDSELSRAVLSPNGRITLLQNYSRPYSYHPFLPLLTLGVIPQTTSREFSFTARYEVGGVACQLGQEYRYEAFFGWFACVQWLFPGWKFESGLAPSPSERAFYTMINRFVMERSTFDG